MKEIIAVIRINKMNQTKKALIDIGVSAFTARKVMGRGKGKVDYFLLKGAEQGFEEAISQIGPGPKMIPKRMLTIVAPDEKVESIVSTLIETNRTNSPGDGKIFVAPVFDAVRIRTGSGGETAVGEASE